jgi:hypothetical protein
MFIKQECRFVLVGLRGQSRSQLVVVDPFAAQYLHEVLMEPLHLFEGSLVRPRVVVPNGCEHQVATGIEGMYAAHTVKQASLQRLSIRSRIAASDGSPSVDSITPSSTENLHRRTYTRIETSLRLSAWLRPVRRQRDARACTWDSPADRIHSA